MDSDDLESQPLTANNRHDAEFLRRIWCSQLHINKRSTVSFNRPQLSKIMVRIFDNYDDSTKVTDHSPLIDIIIEYIKIDKHTINIGETKLLYDYGSSECCCFQCPNAILYYLNDDEIAFRWITGSYSGMEWAILIYIITIAAIICVILTAFIADMDTLLTVSCVIVAICLFPVGFATACCRSLIRDREKRLILNVNTNKVYKLENGIWQCFFIGCIGNRKRFDSKMQCVGNINQIKNIYYETSLVIKDGSGDSTTYKYVQQPNRYPAKKPKSASADSYLRFRIFFGNSRYWFDSNPCHPKLFIDAINAWFDEYTLTKRQKKV